MKVKYLEFDEDGNMHKEIKVDLTFCDAECPAVIEILLPKQRGIFRAVHILKKELMRLLSKEKKLIDWRPVSKAESYSVSISRQEWEKIVRFEAWLGELATQAEVDPLELIMCANEQI